MNKVINKVIPKILPKVFGSIGTSVVGGIKYPPVRDKLLLWANGQLQDGAYVWQDPDDIQDPDAPLGIWRKDKQVSPVEYSMKVSQSHCANFDGLNNYIISDLTTGADLTVTFDFVLNSSHDGHILGQDNWDADLGWWFGVAADSSCNVRFLTNPGNITLSLPAGTLNTVGVLNSASITFSASGVKLSVNGFSNSHSSVMQPATNTVVVGARHNNSGLGVSTAQRFDGQFFNMNCGGIVCPLSEGSGSVVYSSTGGNSGTVTGSIWGTYQDSHHYNVAGGFWMNGDGVKYPYAVSGFTSIHPAGKWNDAESKYQYRDEQVLIDADLLEGEFFFTSGVVTPRTQAEIELYCDGKESVFFCTELLQYDSILAGSELAEVQAYIAALGCL